MILWLCLNPLIVCSKGKQEAGQNVYLTFIASAQPQEIWLWVIARSLIFFLFFFLSYKLSSPGNMKKGDYEVALRFCVLTDSSCWRENLWRQYVLVVSKAIAQLTNFIFLITTSKKCGTVWYTDILLTLNNKIRIRRSFQLDEKAKQLSFIALVLYI